MDNARTAWLLSGVRTVSTILVLAALLVVAIPARAGAPVADESAIEAELDRVRRDPKLASDAVAIDRLVAVADAAPPGAVRLQAWSLAAEAYATRLGRPEAAVPLWRRVMTDPEVDTINASIAARALTTMHLERGDVVAAEAVLAAGGPKISEALRQDVRRAKLRRHVHVAAVSTLAVALGAVIVTLVRSLRAGGFGQMLARTRSSGPLIVAYGVYVAIVGSALASGYEEGTARPFLVFGAVLVPLLLLARAWGAAGATTVPARAARAVLCATSVVAAAFLVLERLDVRYLAGFGL